MALVLLEARYDQNIPEVYDNYCSEQLMRNRINSLRTIKYELRMLLKVVNHKCGRKRSGFETETISEGTFRAFRIKTRMFGLHDRQSLIS